jgi:outer membrane receptor protein involved in Fe transport
MGGNVRLITTKPSFDGDSGNLMVQAGATSRGSTPDYGGSVIGNLVAIPGLLAVRAAVFDNYDEGFLTRTYPASSGTGTVSSPHEGSIRTYGGSLTALLTVTDRFDVTLRFLSQEQGFGGLREAYAPLPDFTPVYTLNRTTNTPESASNHFGLASMDLQYRAENWTLTSATSYYYYRNREVENGTEGTDEFFASYGATLPPTSPIAVAQFTDTSQITEEIRLAATLSSSLSLISGLYYSHNYQDYGLPDVEAAGLSATGFYPNDQLVVFDGRTVNKSSAVFGELYYKFLDKFTLTLGGRYFHLEQQTRAVADGFFVGGPSDTGLEKSSQSGFSPKAALSYAITNDSSVYALFSKGFRPGGPQAPVTGLCLPGLTAEGLPNGAYSSDTVENYEIGAKSALLGGRAYVTAAAFQMNWDNIQQSIVLPCGAGIRANTGDGRIRGGELELNGHLVGGLDVRVGLGAESAVITNAGFAAIPSGQRIFQVPRFNGTAGFVYNFDDVSGYQPYLSIDYNYVGDRLSANNSPENTPLVEPSYSVLNARLGVRFGRSELTLYANNALNEKANLGDIQQIAFPQSIKNASGQTVPYLEVGVMPPLQLGVQFRQRF